MRENVDASFTPILRWQAVALNSGAGLPGFLRGLTMADRFAFVGLSRLRKTNLIGEPASYLRLATLRDRPGDKLQEQRQSFGVNALGKLAARL